MIDWRIIIALILVGVIGWAVIEGWLLSAIQFRDLKKAGRCIEANKAMVDFENGLGVLVLNKTSLPGGWWYLRNEDRPNSGDLVTAIRDFGSVVVFKNTNERKAIEKYKGRVEELLEPLR